MPKTQKPHFALGLMVQARPNAKPIGWPEGEAFVPDYWGEDDYLRYWPITGVDITDNVCSFEMAGWYWLPEDLIAAQ